jgi:L,D-transpeptidase catalytic domain
LCLGLLLSLLLGACGGNVPKQQQAQDNKAALDQLINQAQSIGVPQNFLEPIMNQEIQLNAVSAPFSFLSNQAVDEYYSNVALRYRTLSLQVRGLEAQTTQQLGYQAGLDIQNFESALSQRESQGFLEARTFADQLTQDQALLEQAQDPKTFLEISSNAKDATLALSLMGPANDQINTFQNTIQELSNSGLDVTALQQQAQDDQDAFQTANSADAFQLLIDQVRAQLQATTTLSTQAIPYISGTKLAQLSTNIEQMKLYQIDISSYQQQLENDRSALGNARTIADYLKISAQLDSDLASTRIPLLQGQASTLLQQYYQEVSSWGASHHYYDKVDGQSYILDYEYDEIHGFGGDLDHALQEAQTPDDYQIAIEQIQMYLLHLKAMEADYNDHSPYTQPHATDLQLIQHDKPDSGTVIVVSLLEQALRFYQNGTLVKAFPVTTGQYDRPTPPGLWQIFVRQSPMIFTSLDPKGSAFWYPDTNINYAMEYRDGGYYFHDSWWRLDYGPGTNFPHNDSGGDQSFAGSGSHGCVNMSKEQADWLYQNTSYGTTVIIY